MRLATKETGLEGLDEVLHGPTAVAVSDTDPVAPAKVMAEYAKGNDKLEIKSGFMDGKVLSLDENSNIFTTLKGGKTTILVTNDDGTTININLTVIQDVDSISVTSDDINLNNALIETGKYQVKLNSVEKAKEFSKMLG